MVKRVLAAVGGGFAALGVVALTTYAVGAHSNASAPATTSTSTSTVSAPLSTTTITTVPPTTAVRATTTTTTTTTTTRPPAPATTRTSPPTTQATSLGPVPLAGCPVPPHPPLPPAPPPWHPTILVPDSALPAVVAPARWRSDLAPIAGTGMWIWEWPKTNEGKAAAVVAQAVHSGLHQLWVRVGDSKYGFYGKAELDALVPAAHAAGLRVIAWGFPYLYDPVGDARWTAQILAWRSPQGQEVDGYSADIERSSEGVDLTARRVAVYLEGVRRAAGSRLVVATVYPPSNYFWPSAYPYTAISPYVDAFAPMIYWGCTDPGSDVRLDVARLSTLRPVHIIGQAFNFASTGGRTVSPSAAEIGEFLRNGQVHGALGASFWVWQEATPAEWAAIRAFRW